ncbi:uncharacterized protein LOC114521517 [Dendronephthya gigantea]|uniref:uncharacterized protein LOC114521517 n=1 Tax=Dendronephthya gigantea TaxID=151771 RepID=UPI00106D4565|nr:uncharacterized protein LOC114521517 [Dendronephthya gigantea]
MYSHFNYIDRQHSHEATGNSEKSHKVHCANWKEEVHLRKELDALGRQENGTIKRIYLDQRIVANKFRRCVSRSIDIIKTHDDLKANISYNRISKRNSPGLQSSMANAGKTSAKSQQVITRPVTASELRVRAWERKIKTVSGKLQRAQSAPTLRTNVHSAKHKRFEQSNIAKISNKKQYMAVKCHAGRGYDEQR